MGQPVRDVGWVSLPPPHPCPQRVFLKGWDRQSIFMMQFIIHTGCLRTYGVAFVCQGSGCFMTVTAGICIGGRLLASSLSSSRMKIDTAPWKRARGRGGGGGPDPVGQRARGGGCLLQGVTCTRWGIGGMLSPWWGGDSQHGYGPPHPSLQMLGSAPRWGDARIAPAEVGGGGGAGTPHPGTKRSLSVGQPRPRGR